MVTPELVDYIKSALEQSSQWDTVKSQLVAGGWSDEDLSKAFEEAKSQLPKPIVFAPQAAAHADTSKTDDQATKSDQQTVLIVDDNKFYREFYRSELSQHNFLVEVATDGEEGEKKALELKPDIILLDIILPKKDGFEVLGDLKKNESTKNIPVIISSTLGSNVDIRRLKEMGAINIFSKTTALPKDIAIYIKDVLTHGASNVKLSSETDASETPSTAVKITEKETQAIFESVAKSIEQATSELLDSKVGEHLIKITSLSLNDLETKLNEFLTVSGTIFVCSEIQAKKPSLVILSIKRDDALSLIKSSEHGVLGSYLNPEENEKLLKNIFNVMLAALINELSVKLASTFWSKPPSVVSAKDLLETFNKLNIPKTDLEILMQAEYVVETINAQLSFYAFVGSEVLVKEESK